MDNPNDKAKLAEDNKKQTDEAHRLAFEQQERDRLGGQKPVLASVADAIKKKLENEEFVVAVDDETGRVVPPRPTN